MDSHFLYLSIVVGCISIPLVCSFHPWLKFYKNWKALFVGVGGMMLIFIPWDIYFTHLGIWGFNDKYLMGFNVFHLPVEEIMFFFFIPYACVFTYHCFQFFLRKISISRQWNMISILFVIFSLVNLIFFYDRMYSLVTYLFCSVYVSFHLNKKSEFLPIFNISFLVLLIPFVISNGLLTGIEFWKYPILSNGDLSVRDYIVWYQNVENSGWRLFSIPVEDFSYGYVMLMMVTAIYEKVLKCK